MIRHLIYMNEYQFPTSTISMRITLQNTTEIKANFPSSRQYYIPVFVNWNHNRKWFRKKPWNHCWWCNLPNTLYAKNMICIDTSRFVEHLNLKMFYQLFNDITWFHDIWISLCKNCIPLQTIMGEERNRTITPYCIVENV